MEIQICSDLHFNHNANTREKIIDRLKLFCPDVLVIAGDIDYHYTHTPEIIQQLCNSFNEVIMVPGNHDFYDSSLARGEEFFRKQDSIHSNFKYLNRDAYEKDGVVFIGATGWCTDMDNLFVATKYHMLNDFFLIEEFRKNKYEMIERGRQDQNWFENTLAYYKDRKVVCISHHAPSYLSISEEYRGSTLNPFFANRWEDMIDKYNPLYWIHGHMHNCHNYKLYNTQVICNPYGYPSERNSFDPELFIEIK